MTREFLARLKEEFPETPSDCNTGYRHWQFNFEQFAVAKKGAWKKEPKLDLIERIAKNALKRVRNIRKLETDIEVVQGLGKEDILIIPGYQSTRQAHALGLTDLDITLRVFFSTSWHTSYGMTNNQIERYVLFAKEYFSTFG